jgi:hypothetical protein
MAWYPPPFGEGSGILRIIRTKYKFLLSGINGVARIYELK